MPETMLGSARGGTGIPLHKVETTFDPFDPENAMGPRPESPVIAQSLEHENAIDEAIAEVEALSRKIGSTGLHFFSSDSPEAHPN